MFPEGFDMGALLQQAQQMQQQMEAAQEALSAERVTGTAGGGLVTATMSGLGELVSLRIDPTVIDPAESDTLADLVVAAVRDANEAAEQLQQDKVGPLGNPFGGFGPGGTLPGF